MPRLNTPQAAIRPIINSAIATGITLLMTLGVAQAAGPRVLKNPYASVNWERVEQFKGNFHSHTIKSDGRAEPAHLIQIYADAGYAVLAITDHDNVYRNREGERDVERTHETTWPWTRWIKERPSRVWEREGMETAAFYPGLGRRGMLAVRGNELSQHPHMVSLFNDCGFPRRDQTDDSRIACVAARGGIVFFAHPAAYLPPHRWQDRVFNSSFDTGLADIGDHIIRHGAMIGTEFSGSELGARLNESRQLFDRLLMAHYRDHDLFAIGNDDSHRTTVHRNAVYTMIFAEELTAEAVRHALVNGQTIISRRVPVQPRFRAITVDAERKRIRVDVENADGITWIRNGEEAGRGWELDYGAMRDSVVRFEMVAGGQTFYSQPFYID